MTSIQKNITNYFRDAVASQRTQQVEITEKAVKIPFDMLCAGQVPPCSCQKQFEAKGKPIHKVSPEELDADIEKKRENQQIKVIVALQVVNATTEGGVKYESGVADLTGTFFLPANISDTGILMPATNCIPWIPRNCLSPIMDDTLIVGTVKNVDNYIASQTKELADIKSTGNWEKYMVFAKGFWKAVNDTELFDESIYNYGHEKQPLPVTSFAYIILDNTKVTTLHIQKLYEYALTGNGQFNKLYQTIIGMFPQADRPLVVNELSQMNNHVGQMNGDYPLSPSQREAVNHFTVMTDGEGLAVNGPPGTGKTTLLQFIVANMMVQRALNKDEAPVIVATSTNNQAVTNIIESFAATNAGTHPKHLDEHWVESKRSFAAYFPSKPRTEIAIEKGYQVTDTKMGYSVSQWETEENQNNSKVRVFAYCEKLFGESGLSVEQCKERLHRMLVDFDTRRQDMLALAEMIPFEIQILSHNTAQSIKNIDEEILVCQQREAEYKNRFNAWEQLWSKLLLYRIFGFISQVKKLLDIKMSCFRSLNEEELPNNSFNFADVATYYDNKLNENRIKYQGFQTAKKLLEIAIVFEKSRC